MIERLIQLIPKDLLSESGKVFYSGRSGFSSPCPLYVLGLNPGGDPSSPREYTIASHYKMVLDGPANWSAYRDESWRGFTPGRAHFQRRVLHLLDGVGLDPGLVPASNLVFLRSKGFDGIADQFGRLAESCWPFHSTVIKDLRPRVVLCLGGTTGKYIRMKLGALERQDEWLEDNERGWRNRVYANSAGTKVAVLTHPSRVDWTSPTSDPTRLVKKALR